MKKLTIENLEELIAQVSEINHEDAKNDMPDSKSEAYHSGFATALMVIRIGIRGFEDEETN